MASLDDRESDLEANGALWLEVRHDGRAEVFCRTRDDERAVVLGSLPRADIRVAALGVAPVHLHFERAGDRFLVVPGYANVRVNGLLARGPLPLPAYALIELSGTRVEVLVHATPPELPTARSLDIPDRESGITYLRSLPTDTQTTMLALEPYLHGQVTEVMERLQLVTAAMPAQPQHTLRMARVSPAAFKQPAVAPAPVMETQRFKPVVAPRSALTRLGDAARAHPATVASGAFGLSLALALVLVGLAHVFAGGHDPAVPDRPTSNVTP